MCVSVCERESVCVRARARSGNGRRADGKTKTVEEQTKKKNSRRADENKNETVEMQTEKKKK